MGGITGDIKCASYGYDALVKLIEDHMHHGIRIKELSEGPTGTIIFWDGGNGYKVVGDDIDLVKRANDDVRGLKSVTEFYSVNVFFENNGKIENPFNTTVFSDKELVKYQTKITRQSWYKDLIKNRHDKNDIKGFININKYYRTDPTNIIWSKQYKIEQSADINITVGEVIEVLKLLHPDTECIFSDCEGNIFSLRELYLTEGHDFDGDIIHIPNFKVKKNKDKTNLPKELIRKPDKNKFEKSEN